jgi:hypothetical protein
MGVVKNLKNFVAARDFLSVTFIHPHKKILDALFLVQIVTKLDRLNWQIRGKGKLANTARGRFQQKNAKLINWLSSLLG